VNRNNDKIRQSLGGFDMAMGRHCGNNPEEITRPECISPLFGYNLNGFGYSYPALVDNEKAVRILFAFNH
jgi:hypothetical protein